jgi:hypothetical protein
MAQQQFWIRTVVYYPSQLFMELNRTKILHSLSDTVKFCLYFFYHKFCLYLTEQDSN